MYVFYAVLSSGIVFRASFSKMDSIYVLLVSSKLTQYWGMIVLEI